MNNYNFELERVIKEIKKQKAKIVCLQFPDGLKKKAAEIAEYVEKSTKAKCIIWMSTCFGACDIPNVKADLLIQFGHSEQKLF